MGDCSVRWIDDLEAVVFHFVPEGALCRCRSSPTRGERVSGVRDVPERAMPVDEQDPRPRSGQVQEANEAGRGKEVDGVGDRPSGDLPRLECEYRVLPEGGHKGGRPLGSGFQGIGGSGQEDRPHGLCRFDAQVGKRPKGGRGVPKRIRAIPPGTLCAQDGFITAKQLLSKEGGVPLWNYWRREDVLGYGKIPGYIHRPGYQEPVVRRI